MNNNRDNQDMAQPQTTYRLMQKKFHCHACAKDFKKMYPSLQLEDVHCQFCQSPFCEEVTHETQHLLNPNSQVNRQQTQANQVAGNIRQQQAQQQQPSGGEHRDGRGNQRNNPIRVTISLDPSFDLADLIFTELLNGLRNSPPGTQSAPYNAPENVPQEFNSEQHNQPEPNRRPRIVQHIIYQREPNNPLTYVSINPIHNFIFPESIFFFNQNEELRNIFLRSMNDMGRTGNPPASANAIASLKEVKIQESDCKVESSGKLEYPKCTICCEEMMEVATQLPCGHTFDKECIVTWLNQHNQCPICRHELESVDLTPSEPKTESASQSSSNARPNRSINE